MKKILYLVLFLFIIARCTESQVWVQKLNGISMWSLTSDIQGSIYAGSSGTVKSIYKSTDSGNNWNAILQNGASNFLSISVDSLNNIYAANVSNGLMKSTDGGNNWTNIPAGVFNGNSVEVVLCGKNGYVYAGTIGGGIYRSSNYGTSFPDTAISGVTFVTLVADSYNSNIIYAGASSTTGTTGFFKSTNSGLTYNGPYNTNTCWGVVQKSPVNLFMITTTTGYPFSGSTNGGLNWATLCSQPGAMRGMTLDLAGNVYICGNGGVFKSTDNGSSFSNFNFTSSGNQIIRFHNSILAAVTGTTTGGVWIYTDSLLNVKPISNYIPGCFALYRNYPNPFNPATKIRFDIPSSPSKIGSGLGSDVKLIIYDVLGREVTTLVNEKLNPGTYEVSWDATGYPSGIYFYSLKAGVFSRTKKMILIK